MRFKILLYTFYTSVRTMLRILFHITKLTFNILIEFVNLLFKLRFYLSFNNNSNFHLWITWTRLQGNNLLLLLLYLILFCLLLFPNNNNLRLVKIYHNDDYCLGILLDKVLIKICQCWNPAWKVFKKRLK